MNNNKNIEKICDYFQNGETKEQRLGVELEHFVCNDNMEIASYETVKAFICEAAEASGGTLYKINDKILGMYCDEYSISLEPSCQVEISIIPQTDISEVERIYKDFRNIWDSILQKRGYSFVEKGVLPTVETGKITPDSLQLIPKKRYEYMDEYFKRTGKYGKYMMRATASTQISIDYSSEKDAVRKIRIAQILSPLLALLTENQSGFETLPEWKPHILRTQIWNDLDSDRCGYLPESLNDNYSYKKYAEYVYTKPLILMSKGNDTEYIKDCSASDYFDGKDSIDDTDIEHILSMFFPMVRLKKYIEIRMADSMPLEKMLGYTAIIKGIMYNDDALSKLEKRFSMINSVEDIYNAENQIEENGYYAEIYGDKAVNHLLFLYELAKNGLCRDEQKYLKEIFTLPMTEQEYYDNIKHDLYAHKESAAASKEYILNSTAKYHNRVVRTMYMPKIFTEKEFSKFSGFVKDLYGIFGKIIKEYESNAEYRKLFGFSKTLEDLILRERTYSSDIPIARIDIFYNEQTGQFQFCEFNTDGTSAMNEDRELNNALQLTKAYNMFAEKYNIRTCELFDTWIDEFLEIYADYAKKINAPTIPNVAIVDFMESATVNEFEIFRQRFEMRGIKAQLCEIRDIKWDGEHCTTPDGMRVDAIYRRAVTTDILANYAEVLPFIEAVKSGKVCLMGDFRTQIVHNKILFKVMHLEETRRLLTEKEKLYVDAHVPYTVSLTKELLEKDKKLSDNVYNQKDNWIIKPEDSYGSHGVHAGVECSDDEWKSFVDECMDQHYILQRFYVPYALKNIDLTADGEPVWRFTSNLTGMFVYNGKLNGMYSRISFDKMISTQYNEMSLPTIIADKKI